MPCKMRDMLHILRAGCTNICRGTGYEVCYVPLAPAPPPQPCTSPQPPFQPLLNRKTPQPQRTVELFDAQLLAKAATARRRHRKYDPLQPQQPASPQPPLPCQPAAFTGCALQNIAAYFYMHACSRVCVCVLGTR